MTILNVDDNEKNLKQYNETLIRKLEDKTARLERTNRELDQNIAERQRSAAALVAHNQEIQASRSAALNLMDDAVEARNQLETANQGLRSEIAERKRTEEGLRQSEERFHRAVVDSPIPILLHAEDGTILQASNSWCEITGYTREELATIADWTERAYGERQPLVQADIDRLYSLDHRKAEGDYPIRTKRGDTRIWDFSSAPLGRLPDGRRLVISMAMDVTERRTAEREVRRLNAQLEQRVHDRTAQLEAANKELEAFSYSVSHDLRAPLRAVDGFARILAEDHAERLNEEGLRVLNTIRDEARRMDQLIDHILSFARTSRCPMRTDAIDMTALARAVFHECAAQAQGRELRLQMDTLAPAQGDPALVRQVLANLISNAIKYTRPKPIAQIEIGVVASDEKSDECRVTSDGTSDEKSDEKVSDPSPGTSSVTRHPSPVTYFVRDNGVGFDMKYVGKLFGIFQRLHAEDEFEGTGVGLALVQRIVHRHGGRVWAEGKVNEGATFYFTLPAVEMKNGE